MSGATLAYLARLELWIAAAAVVQGGVVWMSWRTLRRRVTLLRPDLRCRWASAHYAALAILPLLTGAGLHLWAVRMGPPAQAGAVLAPTLATTNAVGLVEGLGLAVALAWLLGAAVMASRLAMDAARLAWTTRAAAPADLAAVVETLSRTLDGMTPPRVRAADVGAPQVVGLWRPTLLAPGVLATTMPPAERDAVLLHELAHVRRGDFAWNLCQRILLVLLWFHPAAWALYADIGREREAACDDLAVRHGATRGALARALVRLEEDRARGRLAMALSSRSGLADRIERLMRPQSPSDPSGGLRGAGFTVAALAILAVGAGRIGTLDPAMRDLGHASAFGPTLSIAARDRAGAFELRVRRGRVVAASVDRRPLPREGIVQRGDRVTLMGAGRTPIVDLRITPQGRIQWEARA